jgi:hypothetical protein
VRRAHAHLDCAERMLDRLVSRRVRIASGFLSSRFCTSSTMASCSQRETRRSFPGVHFAFSLVDPVIEASRQQ